MDEAHEKLDLLSEEEKKELPKRRKIPKDLGKKKLKPCEGDIVEEGDLKKWVITECRRCKAPGTLKHRICFGRVLRTLTREPNVDLIDLEKYLVIEYFGNAVHTLQSMVQFGRVLLNLAVRNPIVEYFSDVPEKDQKKLRCPVCPLNPQTVFTRLYNVFIDSIEDFPTFFYYLVDRFGREPLYSARCKPCRETSIQDLNFVLKKYIEWLSTIGIKVEMKIDEETTQLSLLTRIRNLSYEVSGKKIMEIIHEILDKHHRMRPVFSSSWIIFEKIPGAEEVYRYKVDNVPIVLYRLPTETEGLYYIDPEEYHLKPEHVMLIELARKELLAEYPKGIQAMKGETSLRYIQEEGARIIYKLAKYHKVHIGNTREEEMQTVNKLAKILAKYTGGFGILEILLKDPYIQDIYADAPISYNNVYVILQGGIAKNVPEKFITNVVLSEDDARSLISRFRMESGRPFSEAHPLLEMDLKAFKTRVSAVGPPLSPRGVSFAFRRHSRVPWTLLRLVYYGSATAFAAALLSFLIDGNATMLITGSRGAGKTSLLSSIMFEFPQSQRIIVIEDTPELPTQYLQRLGYKVLAMLVGSTFGGTAELTMDDALRLALRLGESAIVIGEVRGKEAKTLYEAMRAGTAGSSVLGTIHGNSPRAVYERVVYDIGIPKMSFNATDVVVVVGFTRPSGIHRQIRSVVRISEYIKGSDGDFEDLVVYDAKDNVLRETEIVFSGSRVIKSIAESWGMDYEDALNNIMLRAKIKDALVRRAEDTGNLRYLSERWVNAANNKMWSLIAKSVEEEGVVEYSRIYEEWLEWFKRW